MSTRPAAIVISDLHAHAWTRFATTRPDGRNSRFCDLLDVLDQVTDLVQSYQPHTLLLLGDLTHRRYYVNFSIYTALVKWLAELTAASDLEVVCLVGNHDIESNTAHALGPLAYVPHVAVIDHPCWHYLAEYGHAYFVPYLPHGSPHGTVAEAFAQHAPSPDGGPSTAFAHYALDGAILSNEFAVPSALTRTHVQEFERVFLGHVHAPTDDGTSVTYVGAPLHFDFGDTGPRYACVLREDGYLRLPLYAPQFVTVTYPALPAPPKRYSGFLRVLNTPRGIALDIQRSAREAGWLGCTTQEAPLPPEATRVLALSRSVIADSDLIQQYVTSTYPDASPETRRDLIQFGLTCLNEGNG